LTCQEIFTKNIISIYTSKPILDLSAPKALKDPKLEVAVQSAATSNFGWEGSNLDLIIIWVSNYAWERCRDNKNFGSDGVSCESQSLACDA